MGRGWGEGGGSWMEINILLSYKPPCEPWIFDAALFAYFWFEM
jgi:hypothetical protein